MALALFLVGCNGQDNYQRQTLILTVPLSAARCHHGRGAGHHEEVCGRDPDSSYRQPTQLPGAHGQQGGRQTPGRYHCTLSETAARHGLSVSRRLALSVCGVLEGVPAPIPGQGAVIGPCPHLVLRYMMVA